MTEKEFLSWLRGYLEGRLVLEPKYSYNEEMLKTILNQLNEIKVNDNKLLLDSNNPNSDFA